MAPNPKDHYHTYPTQLLNIIRRKASPNTSNLPFPPIIRAIGFMYNKDALSFVKRQIALPLAPEIIQRSNVLRRRFGNLGLWRRRGFLLRHRGGREGDGGLLARRHGTAGCDGSCGGR